MTLATVFRILRKNWPWLLLFPVAVAGTVFYLTRNLPRIYTTSATVYTGFASGLSIAGDDGSTSQEVSNAFDNLITTIKSRQTLTEVGLRLLAHHLSLRAPAYDQLGGSAFGAVQALRNHALKDVVVGCDEAATLARLRRLAAADGGNPVKHLLYQSGTPYAVENIAGRITVARKNSSDMLELSAKGDDPAICQQTLALLIGTFRQRYQVFRSSENGNVVKYFEHQTQVAYAGLKRSEDRLTAYGVQHKLINYGEQSKAMAGSKEGAATEFVHLRMEQQAAQASLATLEHKLDERSSVLLANRDLTAKRTELAKMQTRLASAMVYNYPPDDIATYRTAVDQLSEELKVAVRRLYNSTNTVESMPQTALLGDYVGQTLKLQETTARINVLKGRIEDYDGIFNEMAPQGLAIHRLEREVSLAEHEYLSVLHGLNSARLRQKDLEMTGNMNVVDEPALPMKPQPSIRTMLVAVSGAAGFVLLLSFLLGRQLLNGAVQTPERTEAEIGLPLAGAFPLVHKRFVGYDLARMEQYLTEQLRSRISVSVSPAGAPTPAYRLITLWSTRGRPGKTWVGERIARRLVQAGHRVAYLYPAGATPPPDTDAVLLPYGVDAGFADLPCADALLTAGPGAPDLPPFDYVLLELPNLLVQAPPVGVVAQSDLSLLVVRADAQWGRADRLLGDLYRQAARGPVLAVLNAVDADRLEPVLGELPRLRTGLKFTLNPRAKRVTTDEVPATA